MEKAIEGVAEAGGKTASFFARHFKTAATLTSAVVFTGACITYGGFMPALTVVTNNFLAGAAGAVNLGTVGVAKLSTACQAAIPYLQTAGQHVLGYSM